MMCAKAAWIDVTEPSRCWSMNSRTPGTPLGYTTLRCKKLFRRSEFRRKFDWLFGQRRYARVPALLLRKQRFHQVFHLVRTDHVFWIVVYIHVNYHAKRGAGILQLFL